MINLMQGTHSSAQEKSSVDNLKHWILRILDTRSSHISLIVFYFFTKIRKNFL
ncbi:hypothetical protein EBME_1707 [bacterium endosymbiont of Mortierella elongata FMR23-6]|nr:hypothetical protein EBME_1707 [bacterium endosymbiont of Mortierella elongata FMR23-6]